MSANLFFQDGQINFFLVCTALKTAKCICHVSPLYKELFWKETEKPQLIIAGSKILQESIKVSRVNDSRISIPPLIEKSRETKN